MPFQYSVIRPTSKDIDALVVRLAGLGIADAAVDDLTARRERITADAKSYRERAAAVISQRSLLEKLVSGEMTAADAQAHVELGQAQATAAAQVADLLELAAAQCSTRLAETMTNVGDGWVSRINEQIAPVVEQARELEPTVDGISSDQEALDAGGKITTAWAELTELSQRLDQLQTAADDLRGYGFIALDRRHIRDISPALLHYRNPQALLNAAPTRPPGIRRKTPPAGRLLRRLPAQPMERTYQEWQASYAASAKARQDAAEKIEKAEAEHREARGRDGARAPSVSLT